MSGRRNGVFEVYLSHLVTTLAAWRRCENRTTWSGLRVVDETADRVRHVVEISGMSNRSCAALTGLGDGKLFKSLGGHRRFTAEGLLRMADSSGTTGDWLLTGRGRKPRGPSCDLPQSIGPQKNLSTPYASSERRGPAAGTAPDR